MRRWSNSAGCWSSRLPGQRRMEAGSAAVDYTKKDKIVIGVIGGDGIGPILV